MRLLVLLFGLVLLAGCLPPSQSQLRMEMDLEEMKRRLAQLEVQQAETNVSDPGSQDLQLQTAELTAGLDNLRVEFQSINGRLDDMGQQNQQLVDEIQLIKDDQGLQLGSISEQLEQLKAKNAEFSEKLTATDGATASGATVATKLAAPIAKQTELSPEQIYQQALDLIRKENRFVEGREKLDQFVKNWPDHDLAVNALYWSAEALYGEKNYEMAILQLQDVISEHSSHSKAPAALYKQALAFNALGDQQNARTTMQKLIEEYPSAEQVDKAKKFLAE